MSRCRDGECRRASSDWRSRWRWSGHATWRPNPCGARWRRAMVKPATGREFARMYVEVVGWARQSRDEAERTSLLDTAEYFYRLSIEAAQHDGDISAAPLKELSFRE